LLTFALASNELGSCTLIDFVIDLAVDIAVSNWAYSKIPPQTLKLSVVYPSSLQINASN
jgi:hypothetical protein